MQLIQFQHVALSLLYKSLSLLNFSLGKPGWVFRRKVSCNQVTPLSLINTKASRGFLWLCCQCFCKRNCTFLLRIWSPQCAELYVGSLFTNEEKRRRLAHDVIYIPFCCACWPCLYHRHRMPDMKLKWQCSHWCIDLLLWGQFLTTKGLKNYCEYIFSFHCYWQWREPMVSTTLPHYSS